MLCYGLWSVYDVCNFWNSIGLKIMIIIRYTSLELFDSQFDGIQRDNQVHLTKIKT